MTDNPNKTDARERKRARFDEQAPASNSNRALLVIAAAIVVALAAGGWYLSSRGGTDRTASSPTVTTSPGAPASPAASPATSTAGTSAANAPVLGPDGDSLKLPASGITPTAAFYKIDAGGTTVPFFAVRDSAGNAVVALDACNVCAHAKKGYQQKGAEMLCKNCGLTFAINELMKMGSKGGCHPITLPTRVEGDSIVVNRKDLEAGVKWF